MSCSKRGLDSNPGHSGEDSFIVDIKIWVGAAFIDISLGFRVHGAFEESSPCHC